MLITNDGALAHELLSPRKHVSKTYLVNIRTPLSDNDIKKLEEGVDIGEDGLTAPAFLVRVYEPDKAGNWIHLTIHEGKFHQVKRMLEAVGNEVLSLKRIRFGALALDPRQKSGECRQLTDEEMQALKNSQEIVARKKALLQGKKAVIFDLDGSLVDSMWLWGEIDDEYLARFGIQFYDHDELRRNIEGMSFHETAVYIKKYYNIPDSVEQMKDDWNQMAWDKYANEVPLKPGVLEFLEGCKRAHLKLGIATSNSRELVENVLHVHRLDNCFSCILTGNEITKGKPAPDIYLAVAKQLGVDPSECLVFEDIIPGLMAGKNAGMTICAVADLDSADSWQEKKALADDHIYDYYDFFDHT